MSKQDELKKKITQLCEDSLRVLAELRKALSKRHVLTLNSDGAGTAMLKRRGNAAAPISFETVGRKGGEPSRGIGIFEARAYSRIKDTSSPGHQASLTEARRVAGEIPRPGPGAISGLNVEEILRIYRDTFGEIRRLQLAGAHAEDVGMSDIRLKSLQDNLFNLSEELHARGVDPPDLI